MCVPPSLRIATGVHPTGHADRRWQPRGPERLAVARVGVRRLGTPLLLWRHHHRQEVDSYRRSLHRRVGLSRY